MLFTNNYLEYLETMVITSEHKGIEQAVIKEISGIANFIKRYFTIEKFSFEETTIEEQRIKEIEMYGESMRTNYNPSYNYYLRKIEEIKNGKIELLLGWPNTSIMELKGDSKKTTIRIYAQKTDKACKSDEEIKEKNRKYRFKALSESFELRKVFRNAGCNISVETEKELEGREYFIKGELDENSGELEIERED